MARGRGQALVEFALILPILLLVILGGIQIGLAEMVRYELEHAAVEGVTAGANADRPARVCPTALATTTAVYAHPLAELTCRRSARLVEVRAGVDLPLLIPIGGRTWRVSVTERAELR